MNTKTTLTAAATTLAATLCLCAGCGESPPAAAFPEPDQVYSDVRGRVTVLPGEGPIADPLHIKHEAIPEFVGWDGQVHVNRDGSTGMNAMEMPFPEIAPGVSFEGIEPGDPVAFEFAVAWDGRAPRYWLTAVSELPADVELELPSEAPAVEPDAEADTDSDAAQP